MEEDNWMPVSARSATTVIAVALAVSLFGLGVLQSGDALVRFNAGAPPPDAAVDLSQAQSQPARNVDLLQGTDQRFGDPRARILSGLLRLGTALESGDGESVRREHAQQAIDDLTDGLSRAPANPAGWAGLANARLLVWDIMGAAGALRMSLETARVAPALTLWRVELGLRLWSALEAQARQLVRDQVQLALKYQRRGLVTIAAEGSNARDIRAVLASDPDQLAAFEQALNQKQ